jgi:uncharacterized protein (TIGR00297 family)
MNDPFLFLAGLLLNAGAAIIAFRLRSVDLGGAAAGTLAGTLIFFSGGPFFWIVMAAFFLSSSALSRLGRKEKASLEAIQQKGSRRDWLQVIANGGAGTAAAVMFRFTGKPAWAIGFAAAFAAANADTWASEIGVLSRKPPISLLSFKPVQQGISGGVSALGLSASFGGAVFVAFAFGIGNLITGSVAAGIPLSLSIVTLGGLIGSIVDSVLGATLQAQYSLGGTGALTEKRTFDGLVNRRVRGYALMTNDTVNLLSTTISAAAGGLLFYAITH